MKIKFYENKIYSVYEKKAFHTKYEYIEFKLRLFQIQFKKKLYSYSGNIVNFRF